MTMTQGSLMYKGQRLVNTCLCTLSVLIHLGTCTYLSCANTKGDFDSTGWADKSPAINNPFTCVAELVKCPAPQVDGPSATGWQDHLSDDTWLLISGNPVTGHFYQINEHGLREELMPPPAHVSLLSRWDIDTEVSTQACSHGPSLVQTCTSLLYTTSWNNRVIYTWGSVWSAIYHRYED